MKMGGYDTGKVEPEFNEILNTFYTNYYPGWFYVEGYISDDICECLSNEKTGSKSNYTDHQCDCTHFFGGGNFALCEFRYPRGE
jgi:hypothetical protein